MVSQRQPVPKKMAVLGIINFFIAVFIDHILYSVNFVPTIISVNKNIFSPLSIMWQHHRDWKALHRYSLLSLLDLTTYHLVSLNSFLLVVKIIQSLQLSFFFLFRFIACRSYRFFAWVVGCICLIESGVVIKCLRYILYILFISLLCLDHKTISTYQRLLRFLISDYYSCF